MRRGQAFTLDLIIAMIVVVIIMVFVGITLSSSSQTPHASRDAQAIAGALFKPFPLNWTPSDVVIPGIVYNHRVNMSAINNFALLNDTVLRYAVGVRSEYLINITTDNATLFLNGTPAPADANVMYVVRRYAVHNGTIATVEVTAWDY